MANQKEVRVCSYVMQISLSQPQSKERSVDRELGSVRTSTGLTVNRDLDLQKSRAGPTTFEVWVPYRPKGGHIVDPELVPKKTRLGPVTNRTTGAESTLLYGRQGAAYGREGAVSEGTKSTDLSQVALQCLTHTLAHSVHIIRCSYIHAQCCELQPLSARLRNNALQPNLESQHQQAAKNNTRSDPIRNSSALDKSPYSYLFCWNQF